MIPTKAIIQPRPDPSAWIGLFTFPPAGYGATFYHAWGSLLPPGIELNNVQLPGRENRYHEKPISNMQELIDQLDAELQPAFDRQTAFFGHSMGAWVAFELARRMEERGCQPACLIVSGRQPPGCPDHHPPLHRLPDAVFITEIQRRYGAIPPVVQSDPELLALFLPALRADVMLIETYIPSPSARISIPITTFSAENDPIVPKGDMIGWRDCTQGPFSQLTFPGGHFFLQQYPGSVVTEIIKRLEALRHDGN